MRTVSTAKIGIGRIVRTSGLGDVKVLDVLQGGRELLVRDSRNETHWVRTSDGLWRLPDAAEREQDALFEGDRRVSNTEVREIEAACQARGELWNGMITHYLRERYGDRLYHLRGHGWFVRAEARA
jgi:hypothetical protein